MLLIDIFFIFKYYFGSNKCLMWIFIKEGEPDQTNHFDFKKFFGPPSEEENFTEMDSTEEEPFTTYQKLLWMTTIPSKITEKPFEVRAEVALVLGTAILIQPFIILIAFLGIRYVWLFIFSFFFLILIIHFILTRALMYKLLKLASVSTVIMLINGHCFETKWS